MKLSKQIQNLRKQQGDRCACGAKLFPSIHLVLEGDIPRLLCDFCYDVSAAGEMNEWKAPPEWPLQETEHGE